MSEERLLDLRGLRCPWPALRVGRALREGDVPVMAVADDPAATAEIAAVAAARGWVVTAAETPLGIGLRLVTSAVIRAKAAIALPSPPQEEAGSAPSRG